MSFTVLDAGLYSLVVDAGRPASRALGVPVGGAADRVAFALGNGLVGNPPDAPALEATLRGPTLRANRRTACVVYGAPFEVVVPGWGAVPAGRTFMLGPGDEVRVGGTPAGVRGYLCVGGGFDAPVVFGSRSGLDPVRTGDVLPCGESVTAARSLPSVVAADLLDPPSVDPATTLRVLAGPQRDWFPDDAFFARSFTVSPASNRMGLRLVGEPLAKRPGELASEPVAPGAVQVTHDGRPVVLGVDGQTIGGYPKVAHVVRADLDRLARLRPGAAVRFRLVTPAEAEAAARDRAARLREWLTRLRVAHSG